MTSEEPTLHFETFHLTNINVKIREDHKAPAIFNFFGTLAWGIDGRLFNYKNISLINVFFLCIFYLFIKNKNSIIYAPIYKNYVLRYIASYNFHCLKTIDHTLTQPLIFCSLLLVY